MILCSRSMRRTDGMITIWMVDEEGATDRNTCPAGLCDRSEVTPRCGTPACDASADARDRDEAPYRTATEALAYRTWSPSALRNFRREHAIRGVAYSRRRWWRRDRRGDGAERRERASSPLHRAIEPRSTMVDTKRLIRSKARFTLSTSASILTMRALAGGRVYVAGLVCIVFDA